MHIKVLPNLDEGLRIVGFLRPEDTFGDILLAFEENSFTLLALSANAFEELGLQSCLVQGGKNNVVTFSLERIWPNIK